MTSYTTIQKDQLTKIGAHLKENREQQEKSVEDISLQTYIRPQLIKAIESCIPADLPQPIFVQGFIRRYAEALGLDGVNISKQFPVHSLPDTPRPTPQPAKPSMFSSQAMANPVVTGPKPISSRPTQSTTSIPPKPVPDSPIPSTSTVPTSIPAAAKASSVPSDTLSGIPAEPMAPDLSTPNLSASEPSIADPMPTVIESPAPVAVQSVPTAQRELQPLNYGSDNNSNKFPANSMPYILAGVLAAVAVVAIAIVSSLGNGQQRETAQTPEVPETPVEVVETPEPTPEPEPEPEAISEAPVYLQVEVTEAGPSWMQVTVDGTVAYSGMVQPGETKLWEGQSRIAISGGAASAVLVAANGAAPEPAGSPGGTFSLSFAAPQ